MLGNFLCCITGFKDPLTRKWEDGISLETVTGKWTHLLRGESPVFLVLWQKTWGFPRVVTGTAGTHSYGLRKVHFPRELREASRDSSPVGARS